MTEVAEVESKKSSSSGNQVPYEIGDKLLCKHGPLLYLAKVLDVDQVKGEVFIHYDGWKPKWDEWVSLDRIYEDNEENRKLRDQLKAEQRMKTLKSDSFTTTTTTTNTNKKTSSSSGGTSVTKRSRKEISEDSEGGGELKEEEDVFFGDTSIKLNLSEELKSYIIRDWENLTQKNMICSLPKPESKTVKRILEDFVTTKKKLSMINQICDGLSVYFDRALPTILLYRSERVQYESLMEENNNKRLCEIYGGEHLLRLFVRLPQLLVNTDLDDVETKQLCTRLVELLKFITKNATDYFGTDNDGTYIPLNATTTVTTTTTTSIEINKKDKIFNIEVFLCVCVCVCSVLCDNSF